MPKYCPNCGHQVDGGALFCDNCGTKLQERPNTPPEPQPQQPVQPPQQPTAQTVLPQQQPAPPMQPVQQPDRRAPMPPMPPAQQPGRQMPPPPPAGGQYGYPAPQPPRKKKSGVAVVIIIVVALLMALTAVIGFIAYRAYKRYVGPADTGVPETTVQDVPTTAPKTSEAPETSTEPPVTAPRFDDVERPVASDFAWIADGDGVFESGPYLDSAAILGKWKCEIVYRGIWELCVVTIEADGAVEFEPLEINYGEGWEDEEGEEHYYFEGEVTEGSASGSGKFGSINLFEFVEIGGIQYGKGMFHVNDYGSCDVYLIRP